MNNKYKAVIIGLGNIAWRYDYNLKNKSAILSHAKAYLNNKNTILAGGYSPEKKDRIDFEKEYNVGTYDSIDELIAKTNPDIISICSPTQFHFEHLSYCINLGIPMIWMEKPLVNNKDELILLEKLFKTKIKSIIAINFQRRYSKLYNKIKDEIQQKKYGDLKNIYITYSKGLLNNGSHAVDILFYILNEDIFITKVAEDNHSPSFAAKSASNIIINFIGLNVDYHCFDIIFVFDRARISIVHGGMDYLEEVKKENELYPGFYKLSFKNNKIINDMDICLLNCLKDLISSYENNKEPVSNINTAYKTQKLVNKILSR